MTDTTAPKPQQDPSSINSKADTAIDAPDKPSPSNSETLTADARRVARITSKSFGLGALAAIFFAFSTGFHAPAPWQQAAAQLFHIAAASSLWCLGLAAAGAVLGFLFGIPRVIQSKAMPVTNGAASRPAARSVRSRNYNQRVNNNLEEISDWLTKIIVGLGLVELRILPDHLSVLANRIAEGLSFPNTPAAPGLISIGWAMIAYFAPLGFLTGYILTRMYLSRAFAANEQDLAESVVEELFDKVDQAKGEAAAAREIATAVGVATEKLPNPEPKATSLFTLKGDMPTFPRARFKPFQPVSTVASDPNKGKFDGVAEAGGYRLSATVSNSASPDLFDVRIEIRKVSTDGPPPTQAIIHLHPTFIPDKRTVTFVGGLASLNVLAWGAFTVGVQVVSGPKLELDLAQLPSAPEQFRAR